VNITTTPTHTVRVGAVVAVPVAEGYVTAEILATTGSIVTVVVEGIETRRHFPDTVLVVTA